MLLAGYVALRVFQRRGQFFKVTRGLVLALTILALSVLWLSELAAYSVGDFLEGLNRAIGVFFVILTAWLSTVLVSLNTLSPRLNSLSHFRTWLGENPINFLTVWGGTGLVVLFLWTALTAYHGSESGGAGWPLLPVGAYLIISISFDLAMPIVATRKGFLRRLRGNWKRDMIPVAAAWTGISTAEFALDLVPETALHLEGGNPHAWVMLVLFVAIARSTQSAGFLGLVVSPEIETLRRDGFRPYDIPRGVYLILDSRPDAAFSLFAELCTLPLRPDARLPTEEGSAKATLEYLIPSGLVVTREYPDNVRQKYNLQTTPIMWLTETTGDRRIAPTSLTVLADTLTRFMEANPNSIVLLEGVEYLVTHNGFRKVLKQLDLLNEVAWISKARLLITADPRAFDARDLALLERDRNVVRGPEDVEELKRESMVAAAFE